jgi:hypothetical protein
MTENRHFGKLGAAQLPGGGLRIARGRGNGVSAGGVAARRCGWASTWACVLRGEQVRSHDSDPGWYIARLQRA